MPMLLMMKLLITWKLFMKQGLLQIKCCSIVYQKNLTDWAGC